MNSISSKFDAIVVGAGPAGATAAYGLAKRGYRVLLVERGRGAGTKQVFGGRVYSALLEKAYGSLKDAPIHRWVKVERLSIVDSDEIVTLEFRGVGEKSFTTYLPQLTNWMVEKAVGAGAVFVDEVRVDKLLTRDGRVAGIVAGPDKVEADVVIDAEGVNRLLLERLGLVSRPSTYQVALGVKEVIKIGEKQLEERLGVGPGEGVAWLLIGSVTDYIPGGAFIYANKDSVSIGIVIHLDSAVSMLKRKVYELVEALRLHPKLGRLWADGDIMEYAAHLTIESPDFIPRRLVHDGLVVVGDAAGLILNAGFTIRGVDYAVYSGILAAEAVECAMKEGGPSLENLKRCYEDRLKASRVYRDIMARRKLSEKLKEADTIAKLVKTSIASLRSIYELDEATPKLLEAVSKAAKDHGLGLFSLLLKLLGLVRAL